jgi:hypothetical protein
MNTMFKIQLTLILNRESLLQITEVILNGNDWPDMTREKSGLTRGVRKVFSWQRCPLREVLLFMMQCSMNNTIPGQHSRIDFYRTV